MRRAGSLTYGVRLDGLMVVDLDTDNDATRAYFANRFEPSPIIVATGRGSHHYYRYRGPAVSAVREPEIAIDFKSGKSAFVVGPGSLRPDGKSYQVLSDDFAVPAPWFVDRGPIIRPAKNPALAIPVGSRHPELLKKAVEYCHCVDTFDELLADLQALSLLLNPDSPPPPPPGGGSAHAFCRASAPRWRKGWCSTRIVKGPCRLGRGVRR